MATYRQYWDEMEGVYAKAEVTDGIKKYAAGPALVRTQVDTERMKTSGNVFTGTVDVQDPTVTKLDLNRKIPNATVSSCLDVSQWSVINKETKRPVPLPTDRLTKYISVATIERWPDGWKVIKDEPQKGRPC
ncbi:secreted protein/lipoprotein [Streptomyces sp. NPDC000229]|uniref:secreted protein/lipoprotein n=1 Tax=Streptomyces sp. NPDC000229 TaxID=3154247 RepID=UPI00332F3DC2